MEQRFPKTLQNFCDVDLNAAIEVALLDHEKVHVFKGRRPHLAVFGHDRSHERQDGEELMIG